MKNKLIEFKKTSKFELIKTIHIVLYCQKVNL